MDVLEQLFQVLIGGRGSLAAHEFLFDHFAFIVPADPMGSSAVYLLSARVLS